MNFLGFNLLDTIDGLFVFYFAGIVFGFLIFGFIRFLLLSVFERREG